MSRRFVFALLLAFAAPARAPRPEYPQSQFQRDEWPNLNGPWEFGFDDGNAGYTQITDVEQEINGLLTCDRQPKFDSRVLRELEGMPR